MSTVPLIDPGTVTGPAPDLLTAARRVDGACAKTAAVLAFATAVNNSRGGGTDDDVAGITDKEIAELIGHVASEHAPQRPCTTAGVDIDDPVVTV